MWLTWRQRLRKASFFKMFFVHTKTKPALTNSSRLKSVFWKAKFSWRISVDGRPNRRKTKLRFQIFPAKKGRCLRKLRVLLCVSSAKVTEKRASECLFLSWSCRKIKLKRLHYISNIFKRKVLIYTRYQDFWAQKYNFLPDPSRSQEGA